MTALLPGDCILYAREGNGLADIIFQWAAGPWGHAACYLGMIDGKDTVVEAIGRGVLARNLANDTGRYMLVRRPVNPSYGKAIAAEAWKVANDSDAWYDAGSLIQHIVPRLLVKKLFGWDCGFGYSQDQYFYCSELYIVAAWRAGYPVWPLTMPSVPSDLAVAAALKTAAAGRYPGLCDIQW